jgi:hypothetical protein
LLAAIPLWFAAGLIAEHRFVQPLADRGALSLSDTYVLVTTMGINLVAVFVATTVLTPARQWPHGETYQFACLAVAMANVLASLVSTATPAAGTILAVSVAEVILQAVIGRYAHSANLLRYTQR